MYWSHEHALTNRHTYTCTSAHSHTHMHTHMHTHQHTSTHIHVNKHTDGHDVLLEQETTSFLFKVTNEHVWFPWWHCSISGPGYVVPESANEKYFDPYQQESGIWPRLTHSIRKGWVPLTLPPVRCGQSNMVVAYGKYSINPCKKGAIVTEVGGEKIDLNEAKKRIKLGQPRPRWYHWVGRTFVV